MCWNDTEDIANNIAAAKSAVEQANNTVANVSNTLAPIQKQLEEWQKQYGDSNATSDDINKALNDANTSGACEEALRSECEWSCLAFHIKSNVFLCSCSGGAERDSSSADEEVGLSAEHLISAVQHLRQHPENPPAHWTGSQCCQQGTALQKSQSIPVFSPVLQAVTRLSVLQVSVSMQFNGNSGVQVRTPSNVADLAAYSSLHMYIKLPRTTRTLRQTDTTKPQFVLYLGNKDVSQPPQPNSDLYLYDMLHVMYYIKVFWVAHD